LGRQIEVVHAPGDEAAANAVLAELASWLCLPRFVTSSDAEPVPLGRCSALDQVVFPEVAVGLVRERLVPLEDGSGRFHVFPKEGICLEWRRTRQSNSRYIPGRYYVERTNSRPSQILQRAFERLSRWIRKRHPLRSSGRSSVFVGPFLSEMVRARAAEVVYAGGNSLPLLPASNPRPPTPQSRLGARHG
jgi:hypothetical protein